MPYVAICNAGFEYICLNEIKRIIPNVKQCRKEEELIFFECNTSELVELIYRTQSLKKVLFLLASTNNTDESDHITSITSTDFSIIDGSFASRAQNSSFEKKIGACIYEQLSAPVVNLKNPDFEIYTYKTSKKIITGIDLTGDLSKRSYKIFPHSESLKGTLAYFLVQLSGYEGKGIFLDPCAGSGTICIEAALFASTLSPRFYDKRDLFQGKFFENIDIKTILKKIDSTYKEQKKQAQKTTSIQGYDIYLPAITALKKNVKIAGVEQFVSSGRGDIDWLETKFAENSVDHIACNPPLFAKHNSKKMNKFYDTLFYQCEFILSKKGRLVIFTNNANIESFAEKFKLKTLEKKEFQLGSSKRFIFVFGK